MKNEFESEIIDSENRSELNSIIIGTKFWVISCEEKQPKTKKKTHPYKKTEYSRKSHIKKNIQKQKFKVSNFIAVNVKDGK